MLVKVSDENVAHLKCDECGRWLTSMTRTDISWVAYKALRTA